MGILKRCEEVSEFLLTHRPILDVILLLMEIGAENAVAASDEETAEVAVGTVFTERERGAVVGFVHTETVIAEFRIVEV